MKLLKLVSLALSAAALTTVAGCTAEYDLSSLMAPKPGGVAITATEAGPEGVPDATNPHGGPYHGEYDPRDVALSLAHSYLFLDGPGAHSRKSVIDQLMRDGFSLDEATYAADNVTVNWNTQALKSARGWLGIDGTWTRSQMVGQLKLDGFTQSQATYAVDALGLKEATPTPSLSTTAPPAVTATSPAATPNSEPSDNPTMGTY